MPFSQQNIRFTSLLFSIVVLTIGLIGGIVTLSQMPKAEARDYATLLGIPSVILVQLLHMLRTEAASKQIEQQVAKTRETVEKRLSNGNDPSSPYVHHDEIEVLVEKVAERVYAKLRRQDGQASGG